MLTEDEAQLVADTYLVRCGEQPGRDVWAAVDDDTVAGALVQRRYLDQRFHGDDRVYRLSDEALTAQELGTLLAGAAASVN